MDFLIGTLTRIGGLGIAMVRLEKDVFHCLWQDDGFTDPNWISRGPDGRLFTVSSDAEGPEKGCVNEIAVSQNGLRLLERRASGGNAPCHLCVSADGRFLFAANYGSGSLAVFPLEEGRLGNRLQRIQHVGSSAHPIRQTSPHIHQITQIPHMPDCYCAVDLGTDALVIYQQDRKKRHHCPRYTGCICNRGKGPGIWLTTARGVGWLVTELGNRLFRIEFRRDRSRHRIRWEYPLWKTDQDQLCGCGSDQPTSG